MITYRFLLPRSPLLHRTARLRSSALCAAQAGFSTAIRSHLLARASLPTGSRFHLLPAVAPPATRLHPGMLNRQNDTERFRLCYFSVQIRYDSMAAED